jgi:ribosome biogenesis GTPase
LNHLHSWGWSAHFEAAARGASGEPARVVEEQKERYRVVSRAGEVPAEVLGRLRHEARSREDFPAVGDFVMLEGGAIARILPRRGALRRKSAGEGDSSAQVLAANVDLVLIATACAEDFNERRLERYLVMVWESGAAPLLLLTKGDLVPDPELFRIRAEGIAPGVPALVVSAATGEGLGELARRLVPGLTAALLGSSGVGKSTLVNRLLGTEEQATGAVRSDGRGRHTTSARRLIRLPTGALLLDTPGMRELAPLAEEVAFADIEEQAARCRFRDCRHESEPGCAVRGAVPEDRLENRRKIARESAFHARKHDQRLQAEERRRWKVISRSLKRRKDKRR